MDTMGQSADRWSNTGNYGLQLWVGLQSSLREQLFDFVDLLGLNVKTDLIYR
jgi:hypothetical protein